MKTAPASLQPSATPLFAPHFLHRTEVSTDALSAHRISSKLAGSNGRKVSMRNARTVIKKEDDHHSFGKVFST
jgi:hypothetical protein